MYSPASQQRKKDSNKKKSWQKLKLWTELLKTVAFLSTCVTKKSSGMASKLCPRQNTGQDAGASGEAGQREGVCRDPGRRLPHLQLRRGPHLRWHRIPRLVGGRQQHWSWQPPLPSPPESTEPSHSRQPSGQRSPRGSRLRSDQQTAERTPCCSRQVGVHAHVASLLINVVRADDTNSGNTVLYASTISFICCSSIMHEQRCHCFCSVLLVRGDICSTGKTVNFMQWFVTAPCHSPPARASKISSRGEITGPARWFSVCQSLLPGKHCLFIYLYHSRSTQPSRHTSAREFCLSLGGYIIRTLCGLTVINKADPQLAHIQNLLRFDLTSKRVTHSICSCFPSTLYLGWVSSVL